MQQQESESNTGKDGQRDANGRFLPGNRVATNHGLHSSELPGDLSVLRAEVEAFLAAALVDEGDLSDLPERRKALLEYRARLHRRILQLDGALELRGLTDKRGKLRVQWLAQLSNLIAAAQRIDALLGLKKRPKRIASLAEVLAADGDDRG